MDGGARLEMNIVREGEKKIKTKKGTKLEVKNMYLTLLRGPILYAFRIG